MLYHVSEQPDIARFDPRESEIAGQSCVWAIEDRLLHNYLLPRDCPRVTFYAGGQTSAADVERFLGTSRAVVAFESAWLERVTAARLYCYRMPQAPFELFDACAGYWITRQPVVPEGVEIIDDLLKVLAARDVEVRIAPSLWSVRDAVVASTLEYSLIRMRNAALNTNLSSDGRA